MTEGKPSDDKKSRYRGFGWTRPELAPMDWSRTVNGKKAPIHFTRRPDDRSLAAYKAWVLEFTSALTGKPAVDNMTQEEWEKGWRDFWGEQKDVKP